MDKKDSKDLLESPTMARRTMSGRRPLSSFTIIPPPPPLGRKMSLSSAPAAAAAQQQQAAGAAGQQAPTDGAAVAAAAAASTVAKALAQAPERFSAPPGVDAKKAASRITLEEVLAGSVANAALAGPNGEKKAPFNLRVGSTLPPSVAEVAAAAARAAADVVERQLPDVAGGEAPAQRPAERPSTSFAVSTVAAPPAQPGQVAASDAKAAVLLGVQGARASGAAAPAPAFKRNARVAYIGRLHPSVLANQERLDAIQSAIHRLETQVRSWGWLVAFC
jgi:hypothetical protein